MPASEYLKNSRSGYGNKDESQDQDEPNSTSRTIKLSDEEQKSFEGSTPGQNLTCTVTGTLEEDGHFHVMTVSPPEGKSSYMDEGEEDMAKKVAQMVRPSVQLSPS